MTWGPSRTSSPSTAAASRSTTCCSICSERPGAERWRHRSSTRTAAIWSPRRGDRLYNSFPVRYYDPGTSIVRHPNAGPRVHDPRHPDPAVDSRPRREPRSTLTAAMRSCASSSRSGASCARPGSRSGRGACRTRCSGWRRSISRTATTSTGRCAARSSRGATTSRCSTPRSRPSGSARRASSCSSGRSSSASSCRRRTTRTTPAGRRGARDGPRGARRRGSGRGGERRQGGGRSRRLVGRRPAARPRLRPLRARRAAPRPRARGPASRASPRAAARCAGSRRRTGATFDPRRTLREAMRTGGVPIERAWREPKLVPRKLVYLVDVSGSMEPYARAMVMFLQAAVRAGRHVEAFTFGTRLTRLTPHLAGRDPDRALANAARAVPDWAGGTRIGENLKAFNDVWGRRGLTRGAIVVIASDGWERGDPTLLAEQMRRLHLAAHRVVWTNPLAGGEGYRPLVAGMQAALPYVDDFLPGHNLRALETLRRGAGGDRRRPAIAASRVRCGVAHERRHAPHRRPLALARRRRGTGHRRAHAAARRRARSARSSPSARAARWRAPSRAAASRARSSRRPRACWRAGRRSSCSTASPTTRPGTSASPAAARSGSGSSATTAGRRRSQRAPRA